VIPTGHAPTMYHPSYYQKQHLCVGCTIVPQGDQIQFAPFSHAITFVVPKASTAVGNAIIKMPTYVTGLAKKLQFSRLCRNRGLRPFRSRSRLYRSNNVSYSFVRW